MLQMQAIDWTEELVDAPVAPDDTDERAAAADAVDSDELTAYIDSLYDLEVLSESEEKALALKAKAGDAHARDELARRNLRLVVSIAKHYRSASTPFMDLIQEGNKGLLRALDRFEPQLGYRFSTYATWWIKSHVMDAIGNATRGLRIPAHRLGEVGPIDSLSFENNVSMVEAMMAETNSCVPAAETTVHGRMLSESVRDVMTELNDREQQVITARFGLDGQEARSLEWLGQRLGITRERVRQIEARALQKLQRSPAVHKKLRDYYVD